MPRVPEWELAYLTDVDHYDKESLVALVGDEIVGQAMYSRPKACTGGGDRRGGSLAIEGDR